MLSVVNGQSICIFAYGPTGTGKTFTMMGNGSFNYRGLAPRILEKIFTLIDENSQIGIESKLQIELFEIYNEKIRSLQENEENLSNEVESIVEAFKLLQKAMDKRIVKKTEKNDESSRSHLIFKLSVFSKDQVSQKVSEGSLILVDLAGSERLNESKTTGESLKETQFINKSLSSLGDVMHALYKKEKYVPFRNSKLTLLL